MKTVTLLMISLLSVMPAFSRIWTDKKGRNVSAKVVKVSPSRKVTLKTNRGKIVTVPFDTFVESDEIYLDSLLETENEVPLNSFGWHEMNKIFGVSIWSDSNLWDDQTADVASRMNLKKESKTAFMENHRKYPLGKSNMLRQPVYTMALYGGEKCAENLSFVFLNMGDVKMGGDMDEDRVSDLIKTAGRRIEELLEANLGKPTRDSLGSGKLREKVWRWDWNGHAIMLSLQEGKYTALRIMKVEQADNGGRSSKVSDEALKARMQSCIVRRENDDVVIDNIPMVDQGPKGYCSPATWERYLRYVEIPSDMYLLALAAGTGVGGGTYSQDIIDVTGSVISANGRKLSKIGSNVSMKAIKSSIEKGLPIFWSLMSTPQFQFEASNNSLIRQGRKGIKRSNSGQDEDTSAGGHICLIIGYNESTSEVAISDSWGARYKERWVSLKAIEEASYGDMYVIKW